MQQLISNYRTMFLVRGIAAVLFGILTFVWPHLTVYVLVLGFGVFAVISGITAMAAALRNRGDEGWGCLLTQRVLGLVAWGGAPVLLAITALDFLALLA